MKREWLFLIFLICAGCASQPVALLDGVTSEGAPICLEDRAGIPAVVQKFFATRDLSTEEGKIDYLLERIRNSELVFVRNGVEYLGSGAADFLRWKLNRIERRHHIKINTVQAFVSEVASGSRMSGEPYAVILRDGSRHQLQKLLQNELDMLESCLKQYAEKTDNNQKAQPKPRPEQ